MNVPRLEIYLDKELDLCIAKVDRIGADSRLMVNIGLDELKSYGFEGAENRIGAAVLNTLKIWHKDAFETWEISDFPDDTDDDFHVAMQLIGKSMSTKSAMHVLSIDFLLSHLKTENKEMRKFIEESWPAVRARLESFGCEKT